MISRHIEAAAESIGEQQQAIGKSADKKKRKRAAEKSADKQGKQPDAAEPGKGETE